MRTTVELDSDVTRAVEELKRDGRGVSEAVNELIRRGMMAQPIHAPFVQRTRSMGPALIDVSDVAEALELLEGPTSR